MHPRTHARTHFRTRLPIHVNMDQPTAGATPGGIDLRMTLVSEVLKKADYATHMIGKGHIGACVLAHVI